jgi:hypothetical protein
VQLPRECLSIRLHSIPLSSQSSALPIPLLGDHAGGPTTFPHTCAIRVACPLFPALRSGRQTSAKFRIRLGATTRASTRYLLPATTQGTIPYLPTARPVFCSTCDLLIPGNLFLQSHDTEGPGVVIYPLLSPDLRLLSWPAPFRRSSFSGTFVPGCFVRL